QFAIRKQNYNSRCGVLSGQRSISEYSVTVDGEVINDRSNARYLIEENISDHVFFDLKKGLETFTDRDASIRGDPCLFSICRWACAQQGDTVEKVFEDAEFAGKRGVFIKIANTLHSYHPQKWKPEDAWSMVAVKMSGVILIGWEKIYDRDEGDITTYSGYKFHQYMTTDSPNGEPDTDSPIDIRPAFNMMVRSNISVGGRTLKICCVSQTDVFRGDEPINLKTAVEAKRNGFFRILDEVLSSELGLVKFVVTGMKNSNDSTDGYFIQKIETRSVADLKRSLNGAEKRSYAFLFDILSLVKSVLEGEEVACDISFVPKRGIILITPISMEQAKERKNGVTPEFVTR
ncbi:hypothetical protein PFISCL1PPCAC_24982, partial [Pristionchus fissidentatus]